MNGKKINLVNLFTTWIGFDILFTEYGSQYEVDKTDLTIRRRVAFMDTKMRTLITYDYQQRIRTFERSELNRNFRI